MHFMTTDISAIGLYVDVETAEKWVCRDWMMVADFRQDGKMA